MMSEAREASSDGLSKGKRWYMVLGYVTLVSCFERIP